MGWRNKEYHKTLKDQIFERLNDMRRMGEGTSKREARDTETDQDKIFSYNTYESYKKHCGYFAEYIARNHPECTTLKKAKKYVPEWLQYRVDHGGIKGQPLSAWTIQLERQALGKLFGIRKEDPNFFSAPQRHRYDITRSRGKAVRDKHFSEKNNQELVNFCRGTGCRRNVLEKLQGSDLKTSADINREIAVLEARAELTKKEALQLGALREAKKCFPNQDCFIHHRGDKGGKERYAPIIGPHKQEIIDRMRTLLPKWRVCLSQGRSRQKTRSRCNVYYQPGAGTQPS